MYFAPTPINGLIYVLNNISAIGNVAATLAKIGFLKSSFIISGNIMSFIRTSISKNVAIPPQTYRIPSP